MPGRAGIFAISLDDTGALYKFTLNKSRIALGSLWTPIGESTPRFTARYLLVFTPDPVEAFRVYVREWRRICRPPKFDPAREFAQLLWESMALNARGRVRNFISIARMFRTTVALFS